MNYHGMPVKEFTSDKPVQFAEHTDMLVWNDNSSTEFPSIVYAHEEVIYYDPRVPINRVLTRSGATYDHCAEVPVEDADSTMATCRQLKKWLQLHPYTVVIGRALKDGFLQPRATNAEDYNPLVSVLDKPCNDNGVFNVSGIFFITGRDNPFAPTVSNLVYGVEGVYVPSTEQIRQNEKVFDTTYSIVIVEHQAISEKAVRYGFGNFGKKFSAESVIAAIIEVLGGSEDSKKCVYSVPTACVSDFPRVDCPECVDDSKIPEYLKTAYYTALHRVFPNTMVNPAEFPCKSGVTAEKVNLLRSKTEKGLALCKATLEKYGGDFDKAYDELRYKDYSCAKG